MSDVFDLTHLAPRHEYFGLWAIEVPKFLAACAAADRQKADYKPQVLVCRMQDDEGDHVPLGNGHTLAVYNISGVMMKSAMFSDEMSTAQMAQAIDKGRCDPNEAGAMFVFDTPGGTVAGTSDLAQAIARYCTEKPGMGYVQDLCASAGYWSASACPVLYANHGTALVGSIGTFMGLYDFSGMLGQAGVKAKVYKSGPLKGAGFPGAEITPEQDAGFQSLVNDIQEHFAASVQTARNLSPEQMAAATTGSVFTAATALKMGLIDGIKSFDQAFVELETHAMANLKNLTTGKGQLRDLIRLEDEEAKPGEKNPNDSTAAGEKKDPNDSTVSGQKVEEEEKKDEAAASAAVKPNRSVAMSEPTTKAASLKELKAALPKANAEFIVKAMEDGLTVAAAKDRYIEAMEARAEQLAASGKPTGVKPLATRTGTDTSADTGDAVSTLKAAADVFRKAPYNLNREQAWARACRENHEAREAYVELYNSAKSRTEKKALRYA